MAGAAEIRRDFAAIAKPGLIPKAPRPARLRIFTERKISNWFSHLRHEWENAMEQREMPGWRSRLFRSRALETERRARRASDPASKRKWEQLAILWHLHAHLAATEAGDISQLEFAEALIE